MIMEIRSGNDPTMVVRKKVEADTVIPVSSPSLTINFISEEGDDPNLVLSRRQRTAKKEVTIESNFDLLSSLTTE